MESGGFARLAAVIMIGLAQIGGARGAERTFVVRTDPNGVERIIAAASAGSAPQIIGASRDSSLSSTRLQASACVFAHVPSPATAETLVREIATKEGFNPNFAMAVARTESRFRMNLVSSKGAIGIMQLMPRTAARFGVDICNPADNIRGGILYLRALAERYRNPLYILAAYNAGEDAVDSYHGIPPYAETVRYVASVLDDFYAWQQPAPPNQTFVSPMHAATPGDRTSPHDRWAQGFVMHVNSAEN